MPQNTCKFLVFAFVLLATSISSASKEDSISPESLVAQARKLQEIWTDGTPPIAMRTEIQVFDAKGKATPGQYYVNRVSPSRWREEVQIANYKRLRVHDAKGYWQQSTLNFQPEIIFQLDTLLDFKTVLRVEYPRAENQNPPDISRIEYGAFNKVGERRIPFEVRAFRDRTVVATVKVMEMTPITVEDPALFLAPPNSEFWSECK